MQHNNYRTASKQYIDKCEGAKQVVKIDLKLFLNGTKRHSRRPLQS
jgi:hypothetical protein